MSTYRKSGNIFVTLIGLLLCIALLGGLILYALKIEDTTVYVNYNDTQYSLTDVDSSLGKLNSGEHTFSVCSLVNDSVDYSVGIVPNSKYNFYYAIDNAKYQFSKTDCSKYFNIQKNNESFTLTIPNEFTLTNFLKETYTPVVKYAQEMPDANDYFCINVVTSFGTISLPFNVDVGEKPYVDGVEMNVTLDRTEIIF